MVGGENEDAVGRIECVDISMWRVSAGGTFPPPPTSLCIERACILVRGIDITPADLNVSPPQDYSVVEQAGLLDGFDMRGTLSDVSNRAQRLVERRKIDSTLKECGYNKSRTAERLAVSYKTLLTRIRELELE